MNIIIFLNYLQSFRNKTYYLFHNFNKKAGTNKQKNINPYVILLLQKILNVNYTINKLKHYTLNQNGPRIV